MIDLIAFHLNFLLRHFLEDLNIVSVGGIERTQRSTLFFSYTTYIDSQYTYNTILDINWHRIRIYFISVITGIRCEIANLTLYYRVLY